jgi:hypothetical protein
MTAPVDIVNQALQGIGSQAFISTFADGSVESNLAALLYEPTLNQLLRAAHWNFARKQRALTLLRAAIGTPENPSGALQTPPQPWLYEYAYPSDCLKVRFLPALFPPSPVNPPLTTAPQVMIPNTPMANYGTAFVVGQDSDLFDNPARVILTNLCQAQAVYTALVDNPDLWDSSFEQAMVYTLGAKFVNGIARNKALFDDMAQMAMNIVNQARVTDGNEGVTTSDHLPDWMQVRAQSGMLFAGAQFYTGWDSFNLGWTGGAW